MSEATNAANKGRARVRPVAAHGLQSAHRPQDDRSESRRLEDRLIALGDPGRAEILQRFFKTAAGEYGAGDRFLGIRVPVVRRLARQAQELPLREVAALLRSPWHEGRLLALLVLVRQYATGDARRREAIYRLYLRSTAQINNWDLVDCSAEHIVGAHLEHRSRAPLLALARSRSVWERRIAVIATFRFIKQGEFDETLRIATRLLDDTHDLIHKAAGWMLREIGKRNRAVEDAFLHTHAPRMPRTMLRYAVEHFPDAERRRILGMKEG